jgi:hypothetical protein
MRNLVPLLLFALAVALDHAACWWLAPPALLSIVAVTDPEALRPRRS